MNREDWEAEIRSSRHLLDRLIERGTRSKTELEGLRQKYIERYGNEPFKDYNFDEMPSKKTYKTSKTPKTPRKSKNLMKGRADLVVIEGGKDKVVAEFKITSKIDTKTKRALRIALRTEIDRVLNEKNGKN